MYGHLDSDGRSESTPNNERGTDVDEREKQGNMTAKCRDHGGMSSTGLAARVRGKWEIFPSGIMPPLLLQPVRRRLLVFQQDS